MGAFLESNVMSAHSNEAEVERLLDQLPDEIAEAIIEGDSSADNPADETEFGDESLPYPYNLKGADQNAV